MFIPFELFPGIPFILLIQRWPSFFPNFLMYHLIQITFIYFSIYIMLLFINKIIIFFNNFFLLSSINIKQFLWSLHFLNDRLIFLHLFETHNLFLICPLLCTLPKFIIDPAESLEVFVVRALRNIILVLFWWNVYMIVLIVFLTNWT